MPIEDFSVLCLRRHRTGGDPENVQPCWSQTRTIAGDTADDILDAVRGCRSGLRPCDEKKDDAHYIHDAPGGRTDPGVIGDSWRNEENCWITMFDGSINGHGPGGGEDMAHEWAHYGRRHIQCGSSCKPGDFDFVPFRTTRFPTRNLPFPRLF